MVLAPLVPPFVASVDASTLVELEEANTARGENVARSVVRR
jgi:hypothetical protein